MGYGVKGLVSLLPVSSWAGSGCCTPLIVQTQSPTLSWELGVSCAGRAAAALEKHPCSSPAQGKLALNAPVDKTAVICCCFQAGFWVWGLLFRAVLMNLPSLPTLMNYPGFVLPVLSWRCPKLEAKQGWCCPLFRHSFGR